MMIKIFWTFLLILPLWLGAEPVKVPPAVDAGVIKNAAKVTRELFPDADTVLLRENEFYTYEKSGKYRVSNEFFVKVLTEEGRQSLRNFRFYFNTHYNKVTVERVCIIKPDGRQFELDVPRHSRSVIDSSQMASNIYDPADRRLVVTIPRIEIGDILYCKRTDEHFKPRIPGLWSNYSLLQSDAPILENNIEINAPAALPLRSIALKDEIKGTVTFTQEKKNDRIIYKWSARNVPQVIPEPGMPEFYTCVQRLLVSTARSWEEVSRWYWELCRPRLNAVTPAMKKKAESLVKDKKEPLEKVKALFQFVSQNIRYMGITPEKEVPGYEPHDVNLTFEQRHGVCRDKAALLVAMLELVGIKAYPVLFMVGDPKDDEIPNSYFNHAVTAVELEKGNYVLMDPTYESTADLFPAFQADMSYLVAHPKGEKLRRSPVVPAKDNRTQIRTKAAIDAGFQLRGRTTVKLSGVNDIYYRGALSRWTGESKKLFFTGRLQKVLAGAVLEELKITPENIRDMSQNIEITLTYSAPVNAQNKYLLLPLPEFSDVFGVNEAVFYENSLLKRKYPLKLATTCLVDEECRMELPESCRMMALPAPEHFKVGRKISFSRSAQLSDSVLKVQRKLELNALELSAKEYTGLKKLLNTMNNAAKVIPIALKNYRFPHIAQSLKAFPGANSVIEKYDITMDIRDSSSWSIRTQRRRKILNYAGVKAHSEIKIPVFQGRTKIGKISCTVTAPDGKVFKAGKNEINLMDSPRNGTAPRYPAGKILVVSLPHVAPGSVIDLDVTQEFTNMPFLAEQFNFSSLAAPMISGTLKVSAPERMYLKTTVTGDYSPKYQEESGNGRIFRSWHFSNVARVKNEENQPMWQLFRSGVLVSSGDNKEYAALLNKALMDKVERSLPAAEKLIASEKWREEKNKEKLLIRIRDFVDKFIRKTPVPLSELPLSALNEVSVTLDSGYGNSADRAIVLGAVLKALKIDFHFVGSSSVGGAQKVVRLFNHDPDPEVLTEKILVYLPDLQCFLNDTGRYAALGTCNSENKLGIDLQTGRLLTLRSSTMKETGRRFDFFVQCQADDSAVIKVTETLYGSRYEQVKEELSNATPERMRRFFENRATAISHNAQLTGEPEIMLGDYPGVLRYGIKAEDFLVRSGTFRIMPLPCYQLLQSAGALPVSGERTTPYWRNDDTRLVLRYTIVPPPGFNAVAGRKERVENGKYGSAQFTENYSASSGSISLHSRLYLPVELVSALDFCELENRKRTVSRPEADRIIFEPAPPKQGGNTRRNRL